jgi:hypothetical protein
LELGIFFCGHADVAPHGFDEVWWKRGASWATVGTIRLTKMWCKVCQLARGRTILNRHVSVSLGQFVSPIERAVHPTHHAIVVGPICRKAISLPHLDPLIVQPTAIVASTKQLQVSVFVCANFHFARAHAQDPNHVRIIEHTVLHERATRLVLRPKSPGVTS